MGWVAGFPEATVDDSCTELKNQAMSTSRCITLMWRSHWKGFSLVFGYRVCAALLPWIVSGTKIDKTSHPECFFNVQIVCTEEIIHSP